jgi:hypothetical protein
LHKILSARYRCRWRQQPNIEEEGLGSHPVLGERN